MSAFEVRYKELRTALSAGLRRLVVNSSLDRNTLRRRHRLVGLLLLSPIALAGAAALVLAPEGPAMVVATAAGIFAFAWLAGLYVAQHGRDLATGIAALFAATMILALLVAVGGGLASPVALLLGALAFEPWWIWRTRKALNCGLAAAGFGIGGAVLAGTLFPAAQPLAWAWLPTGAYLASVLLRVAGNSAETKGVLRFEDRINAAILGIAPNGDILRASGRSTEILGLDTDLISGQAMFERMHVGDRVAYMCALSDVRNGASGRHLELRLRLPGAPEVDVYRHMYAEIVAADGDDCHLVLRPVGELDSLRRLHAEALEEVERVKLTKSRFLASMSHELRTPLNAIIGFSDMLVHELYGGFTDERQKEHVTLIRDSGQHLLAVVNSILDVSKIELGAYEINPEPFPLDLAVKMCGSMMSVQADAKGVSLTSQVDPAIGELNADRRAVQQMLINLVSNAVKFTPAGGKVDVECNLDGDHVELLVRDTGIGIAEEDMERLGQPFVQLSADFARRYEGTGLGLALVKGLVHLHQGSMHVVSGLGKGTTVRIRLPRMMKSPPVRQVSGDVVQLQPVNGEPDGAYRKTA